MSVRSNSAPSSAGVNAPIVIAAVAILLILIIGLAWHFLANPGGGVRARTLTSQEAANKAWMQQKAQETGGDYLRLSTADQRRLFTIDGPRAAFDLRQLAHPAQVGQ